MRISSEGHLSRRDRRTLVVGGAVVVGLLLFGRLLPAWRDWEREVRASASELRAEVRRAEREAAYVELARDSLAARNVRYLALAPRLVGSGSATSVAASLSALVADAAMTAGTRLGATQLQTDSSTMGPFTRVGVRGELTGDVRGVTSFIAGLERGPVLLAVRELSITQPEPGAPADRMEALTVHFLVEGLALAPRRGPNR